MLLMKEFVEVILAREKVTTAERIADWWGSDLSLIRRHLDRLVREGRLRKMPHPSNDRYLRAR